MNIPDKAVEAVLDQYGPFLNGIAPEDIDDGDLAALRDEAREILNLAAPFIAAQALRDAARESEEDDRTSAWQVVRDMRRSADKLEARA